jgi:hypothetical protein
MAIPGNEIADEEAKAALEDDPPQDLMNWIKKEDQKTRKT